MSTIESICRSDYPVIRAEDSVREAAVRMKKFDTRWLMVTTDGRVIGLVSDSDIIRKSVIQSLDQDEVRVESIMRVGLPVCSSGASPEDVAEIMRRKHIRQVGVVSEENRQTLLGIVRAEDLIRVVKLDSLSPEFLLEVFR